MSETPAFHVVLFVGESGVASYIWEKKQWFAGEKYSLEAPLSDHDRVALSAKSVLILVSDRWAGHLQMVLPNKKSELTDEHIGQVLNDQYQIDVAAYEFALQNFSVSRDYVQVSVSGLEKEIFQKVENWAQQLDAKKVWIMPFSWFLAALKSVEPALLAVAENADAIYISHQYLGVDDGRVLPLTSLAAYVQARKKERKETHLLYIHTTDVLRHKIETLLGDEVSLQPLLPEHSRNLFLDVVTAVMAKGNDTLAELLHFEVTMPEKPVLVEPVAVVEPVPVVEPVVTPPLSPKPAASELAPVVVPTPIESMPVTTEAMSESESDSGLVAPVPPESVVAAERTRSTKVEVVDTEREEVAAPVSVETSIVTPPAVEPQVTEKAAVSVQPDKSVAPPEPIEMVSVAQRLQPATVVPSNQDRYVAMAPKKSWKLLVGVVMIVAIITGIVGGAIFWSQQTLPANNQLSTNLTPTPQPTASPTPSPTPQPSPAIAASIRSATKILLLNATGIPGLAGKEKTRLAALGWKKIDTGNATGTYQDAYFVSGKAAPDVTAALITDLSVTTKQVTSVKEDNAANYDLVVVIGIKPNR